MRIPTLTTAALLALTACGTDTAPPADDPAATNTATNEGPGQGPNIIGLDETHTYPDGFAISLSDFERFNAADYDYPDDADYVSFTVTFDNGSEEPVELDRVMNSCMVNGVEDSYEAFSHLAHDWPSLIQAGDSGVWEPACEMPADASELQFMVEVYGPGDEGDPSYPAVFFSGEVN